MIVCHKKSLDRPLLIFTVMFSYCKTESSKGYCSRHRIPFPCGFSVLFKLHIQHPVLRLYIPVASFYLQQRFRIYTFQIVITYVLLSFISSSPLAFSVTLLSIIPIPATVLRYDSASISSYTKAVFFIIVSLYFSILSYPLFTFSTKSSSLINIFSSAKFLRNTSLFRYPSSSFVSLRFLYILKMSPHTTFFMS